MAAPTVPLASQLEAATVAAAAAAAVVGATAAGAVAETGTTVAVAGALVEPGVWSARYHRAAAHHPRPGAS
jgi:hypothetical protein